MLFFVLFSQEQCNTLQAENDFKVTCQEELEAIIRTDKEQIKQLETEMKVNIQQFHLFCNYMGSTQTTLYQTL